MTPFPWTDVLIIAGLILLNGLFSMSELAIVSARPAQLRLMAERGSRGARTALALAAEPGKFLSTVQIGITLVGIVAGAYSGSSLGGPVGERFAAWGVPAQYAEEAGFIGVIALTTYFSLVVGELVPKQAALRIAVPVAVLMSQPMAFIAKVAAPFVWVLDTSSAAILRLIGVRHRGEHGLTAEELQMIFADATRSGAIEEDERAIMAGIMKLANRPVRELMTPRTELDWLDLGASEAEMREAIARTPHSLLPVAEGSIDKVVGVVKVREVLALLLAGKPVKLAREHRREICSAGGETFIAIEGEIDSIVFCADADRGRPGLGSQRARNAIPQRFTLLDQLRGQCRHLRNQRLIVLALAVEHERQAQHDPCHDEPGDNNNGLPRPFQRCLSQE